MIPSQVLQRIQDSLRIEEVVSDFVALKKRGRNLWACCPFHQEKTPSFSVSPERGFYKCFGCGAAGDAIGFVRHIEGLDFVEAVRYLAQKYGVPFQTSSPDENNHIQTHQDKLYSLLEMAQAHYTNNLWHQEEGKRIGGTLLQSREFGAEATHAFGIGYSMKGWQVLRHLAQQRGYTDEQLEEVGLLMRTSHARYDLFRGRLMFPIQDASGRVIAFGGRATDTSAGPKYVNSPETALYKKGEVLYGLFQAKSAVKQAGCCLLVEGYTDVVRLHAAGIKHCVALSGTSLTSQQVKRLGRITRHVFLVFDGDAAGREAALRNIDVILAGGLDVSVVSLPEGEDPDGFAQRLGKERFEAYVQENVQSFVAYKTAALLVKNPTPTERAEGIRNILRSISLVPDALKRDLFIKQSSTLLETEAHLLRTEQERLAASLQPSSPTALRLATQNKAPDGHDIVAQERESMRLLLCYGTVQVDDQTPLCAFLLEELKDVSMHTPHYTAMLEICRERLLQGESTDGKYFLQHAEEKLKQVAIELMASPYEISDDWKRRHQIHTATEADRLYQTAFKNVLRLKLKLVQKLVADNQQAMDQPLSDVEEDRRLHIHTALKRTESTIAKALGRVVW